ncbi:MAG: histidinol-phosphatase [Sphaerochaetaceae bacterium]
MITNYHTHCYLDDGQLPLEEYVRQAVDKGFSALGFSCHAPNDIDRTWHLKAEDFDYYLQEINRLKESYKGKIEIYGGLEAEFFELDDSLGGLEYKNRLDFLIGAVHFFYHPKSNRYVEIDYTSDNFEMLLADNFNNDIKELINHYFSLQERLITAYDFDFLAHCNVVEKHNNGNRYFDPAESWYVERAKKMFEIAKKHNKRIEINTGAVARKGAKYPYPSPLLLKECAFLEIPMVLSSDAHHPDNLDYHFSESKELLKQVGYNSLDLLINKNWKSVKID